MCIDILNMSYGATVGASAANSNLIELKKIIFTPVLNKPYVHCDFSKWFIDYLKMLMNLNCLLLLLILNIHISGPATVQNQNF